MGDGAECALRTNAIGGKDARSALDVFGVVRVGPVLAAARDGVRFAVNRDDAAAGEQAHVGIAVFVERDVPRSDAARPVVEDAVEGLRPFGEIGLIVGLLDVGSAFGPVRVLLREGVVHAGHRGGLSDVAVPGDAVDVFVGLGIA